MPSKKPPDSPPATLSMEPSGITAITLLERAARRLQDPSSPRTQAKEASPAVGPNTLDKEPSGVIRMRLEPSSTHVKSPQALTDRGCVNDELR